MTSLSDDIPATAVGRLARLGAWLAVEIERRRADPAYANGAGRLEDAAIAEAMRLDLIDRPHHKSRPVAASVAWRVVNSTES